MYPSVQVTDQGKKPAGQDTNTDNYKLIFAQELPQN